MYGETKLRKIYLFVSLVFAFSLSGCTHQQKIISMGTALGAVAGQVIATSTQGTLIGAGVGALLGVIATQDRTDYGQTRCHKTTKRTYRDGVFIGETVEERCDGYITAPHY